MAKTVEGSTFLYLLDFRPIERPYPRTRPTSSFRNFRVPDSRSALLNDVAPVLAHSGAYGGTMRLASYSSRQFTIVP